MKRKLDMPSFGDALAKALRGPELRPRARLCQLVRDWPEVVGPRNAAHSQPVRLENGTLFLQASSSVWQAQLNMLSGPILERVNAALGGKPAVERLAFVRRQERPRYEPPAFGEVQPAGLDAHPGIEAALEALDDGELRAAMARLVALGLGHRA